MALFPVLAAYSNCLLFLREFREKHFPRNARVHSDKYGFGVVVMNDLTVPPCRILIKFESGDLRSVEIEEVMPVTANVQAMASADTQTPPKESTL